MGLREEALALHEKKNGKLEMKCKIKVENGADLALAYTPGVAEPCKLIKENEDLSYKYTCRSNTVAVCTDGTRVLGLGDIGPTAAMPVMEGKAVLFKTFGDVDAMPLCIAEKDPDRFIDIVKSLEPSFAGINLEDISSPKCYYIEENLKKQMNIPVFHDDQHGTAIACVSAVMGALRFLKKDIKTVKIVVNGAGAAGSAIGRLLLRMGAGNLVMVERFGALYDGCEEELDVKLDCMQRLLARKSNPAREKGMLADIAAGADVLIGVSGPRLFTDEIIGSMGKDPVVFALANPVPEVSYDEAKAAGARIAGTGRSDSPNQVNNVNVFPGMFRGAIDIQAHEINEEMKIAAVYAIANLIDEKDLREDYIVPEAFDKRVAPAVAAAVAKAGMESGVARVQVDPEEVRRKTAARIAEI